MTNLENINYDDIENKIMMVLVQSQGKLLDYKLLFSKVIDRFNITNTVSIHSSFKYKFLLVISGKPVALLSIVGKWYNGDTVNRR